jgi:hypothetical protein
MIDATQPDTPGWWLKRLTDKLAARNADTAMLDSYLQGTNGIPITSTKAARQAYVRLMHMARLNMAELVVEAPRERMAPVGFRTGADADSAGDEAAWQIWQRNSLDADSSIVHRSMLGLRYGYVIVGPFDPDIGAPLITPEDPRQVITESDPRRRRRTLAGLKLWRDDVAGVDHAYLYLPGKLAKAKRDIPANTAVTGGDIGGWGWETEQAQDTNVSRVPVVPFVNRPDAFGCGTGEFEPHLGVLDRINFTILSRLEIATLQAFRQRAVKGVPTHDPAGNEINYDDIFDNDPGAMWLLPATAEMWESDTVDLNPIRESIRDDIRDLAAVSRTPLFYLSPDAANGSAEGAALAREGLVFKTADRIAQTSDSWEEAMSLAFEFAGDTDRAARGDMEVIWAPPERFSLSERYDAASKAQAAGVPWRTVMTDVLQFSPQQVDRMEVERSADAMLSAEINGDAAAGDSGSGDIKSAADALGQLIRAGVAPEDAARRVGFADLSFTGAIPVSLRPLETQAEKLEE